MKTLLTMKDLVAILPFGERTIRSYIRRGVFPRGRKIVTHSKTVVWRREDVEQWIDSRVKPLSEQGDLA